MWILFSILCMLTLVVTDIIGKKAITEDKMAPIRFRIIVMLVSFIIGISMYIFHFGESGKSPWELLIDNKMILVAVCFMVLSEILYLSSLKYIGMSIMEAIGSLEGIFIFLTMTLINALSGRFIAIKEMFNIQRLTLILITFLCLVLLPFAEGTTNIDILKLEKKPKPHIIIGCAIALLAAAFSCEDSIIIDALLESRKIGTVDMVMVSYFSQIAMLPFLSAILLKSDNRDKPHDKIINRYSMLYTLFYVAYLFLGVMAASIDAVRSEIMYLSYPVIAIIGARIVLKEKYNRMQYACIWVITLAAISFCIIDYII